MSQEILLPKLVPYLGDRVTDPEGYTARRAKLLAATEAVTGVQPAPKLAALTDAQRGALAARLGLTA
jgi:hypothetical protein